TVRMVEQTQEAGADAVLVVAPYYSRPSQNGVYQHYAAVNASADKPIIIYDVPSRTGLHLELSTYRRLANLDHVAAVKDATGDVAGAIRKRMETGLTWYSGDDGLFLPYLSVGAVGVISVIAHAAAGPMHELADAFDRGDIHIAQRLAVQLAPLVEALNGNGFQAVMAKAALKVRGVLDNTTMRLPNVGPSPEELSRSEQGIRESKVL
ncbi:MAG: dihydrodipicolinate synthase family protein, partial [Bifidobacterium mongoliense]|nr:dihydrodipicolinate synthase family protein [Bifidobacterium mongoliense]